MDDLPKVENSAVFDQLIKIGQLTEGLRGLARCLAHTIDQEDTPTGDIVEFMIRAFSDQIKSSRDELVVLLEA